MANIPSITWHAGAAHTRPNTIGSVKKAVAHDAQIIEFDVTFAPDSTPVIIHSSAPAQGKGSSLADAFAVVAKSKTCQINLDLKAYSNLPAVDALAEKYSLLGRVFYTGVEEKHTAIVSSTSKIPYYINGSVRDSDRNNEEKIAEYAQRIKACGALGLNTHFTNITPCVVRVMHENGLLVSAWTANKTITQKMLIAAQVDNITTKCPARLKKTLVKSRDSFSQ